MKSEKELNIILAELLSGNHLKYPPATTDTNAPLALIQLSLESEIDLLKQILS